VEDSGTGLEGGAGDSIFDPVFTTKADGMGMGLSISRSIIAAHEGRLWALPGESLGAIFPIVLPSERGRFIWPASADGVVSITAAQLGYRFDHAC
jgi:signal transduction histidine kinase